ncbi:MAG TPA: VOC family protein [Iamia sp.]|jgi:4a-hydroxytetrahydrobiopterin dehydratase|nr:VOC family protein [Iamia sp.]
MADDLTATAFDAEEGLDDWRYLLGRIEATFTAGTPFEAAGFVAEAVTSTADRVPDIDLRGEVAHLSLPPGGPLGPADLDAARALTALAAEMGLTSSPVAAIRSEIAIDAVDIDAVRPFWKAALAYEDEPTPEGQQVIAVIDPLRIGPPVWFQQMDVIRPERNHIHVDITVPHDVAEQRVAAVIAAGGTHLSSNERSFHVLADVEGNELCICTWLDRD